MSSPSIVTVHPLVLLSTVDHFYRVAKDTNKRVVGVLLGEVSKGKIDITNSYAVPFEEDPKTPSIWFLDHNFHENMFAMFKKVSANENVVGWYSTGPKIRPNDLDINEVFRRYVPNPVFVIIDVQPTELGIPTKAYVTVEELKEDGKTKKLEFKHVPSEIGAFEAEEVGVEHLLRDIKDTTISTLASSIHEKLLSLRSLRTHLEEMRDYLVKVVDGKLPVNQQILSQVQDIFNLLPGVTDPDVIRSMSVKTNDMMVVIYLASLVRSVIALHNLINNKLANREQEKRAEGIGKKIEKKEREAADKTKEKEGADKTKEGADKTKEGADKTKDDKTKEKK